MNEKQAKKLKLAAKRFLDIPDKKFDMEFYTTLDPRFETAKPKEHLASEDCGTTACFAGWLPVLLPDDWVWYGREAYPVPIENRSLARILPEHFSNFFGISVREAEYIVYCHHYRNSSNCDKEITKREVVQHIMDVLYKQGYPLFTTELASLIVTA